MILNRLSLVNFGVYRGHQVFDLRPEKERPLIIIGGKNGAGKTTLLEAIRLCLYGPLALDHRTRPKKSVYEQYLRQRIHRAPKGIIPIEMASVQLEFTYTLAGDERVYVIKREWHEKPTKIEEKLQIFENERLLTDIDADQWQDFLRDLIPPNLSQLFFFDGEKIQALAEDGLEQKTWDLDERPNMALAQAMQALLGLNIVNQLQHDLTIYRRRQQKGNDLDEAERQIEILEDELKQLETDFQQFEAEQANLQKRYDELSKAIKVHEQDIAQAGGGFARKRDDYKDEEIRLKAEIEQVEQAIRDLCAGLLPFAIVPDDTTDLKEQLLSEAAYRQWAASKAFIEQKLDLIQAEIEQDEFWQGVIQPSGGTQEAAVAETAYPFVDFQKIVGERVATILQRLVELPGELGSQFIAQTKLLHQVSSPEQGRLLQWIDDSQTTVPKQLQELTQRLTLANKARQKTESALQHIPKDDVLAPLMDKLNLSYQELGRISEQQARLDKDWKRLAMKQEEIKRKLHRAKDILAQSKQLSKQVQLVIDVSLVLDDFAAKLTALRVAQLQERFLVNFNLLCRKSRLLETVTIDAQNFSVRLFGLDKQELPKSDLSAGEKQIYAIAMLWALRQVSGRPLPVLIDTPLGRLDSDHRQGMIEKYFPQASHQVILFSTDTEIDAEFFAQMKSKTARTYHLSYDDEQLATAVQSGYFWKAAETEFPKEVS